MNGKSRCKILKEIRTEIARKNDIAFVTAECKYRGDCPGTCPKCEEELRYLERELEKRQKLGKYITIAGLAATITLAATGCGPSVTTDGVFPETTSLPQTTRQSTETDQLLGDIALPSPPDLDRAFQLTEEELVAALTGTYIDRYSLLEKWEKSLVASEEGKDIFYMDKESGKAIAVDYDKNGIIYGAAFIEFDDNEQSENN